MIASQTRDLCLQDLRAEALAETIGHHDKGTSAIAISVNGSKRTLVSAETRAYLAVMHEHGRKRGTELLQHCARSLADKIEPGDLLDTRPTMF